MRLVPTPRQIFLSAILLLILSVLATGYTLYSLYRGEQWVRHTYDVEVTLGNLQLTLNRAARDRLAYANGDAPSLLDFKDARDTAYRDLASLRTLIYDNGEESARIDQFQVAMEGRLNVLQESIDLADSGKSTRQAQEDFTDKSLQWNFRTAAISDQMKRVEETLLGRRNQITAALFLRIVTAIAFSFLLSTYLIWEHYRRLSAELVQRTKAEREAQSLSHQLLHAQDEERRKISRDLHDGLGQTMVAAKMIADSFLTQPPDHKSVADLIAILGEALTSVRTMSYLLHPPMLDEIGLASATQWFVDGYSKRTGIAVTCQILGEKRRLPPAAELSLFRVLQESLTNIQRHAHSSNAEVHLDFRSDRINLRIQDHGVGIPEESLRRFQDDGIQIGVGLAGMRQRIREQNGTFRVSSDASGTIISVQLPVAA